MVQRAPEEKRMRVWVDQDLCMGDGLCEEIATEIFDTLALLEST